MPELRIRRMKREVYVMVVGETSRAIELATVRLRTGDYSECLSKQSGLVAFPKVLTESNTTHKSVPMLLSERNSPQL